MKSKIVILLCLTMLMTSGCSLMNTGGNVKKPVADWEQMAPVIETRVKFVAAFAFSMDAVKPHKANVCVIANQLGGFLDSYDDKDASFTKLQIAVNDYIKTLATDSASRDAILIITDMVLTESFNYAWQHYEGFINQDQTKVALIIAKAVSNGLRSACSMRLSSFGVKNSVQHSLDVFTVND